VAISPYIRDLRTAIGHEYLMVPSVAVLARDDAGRLLLVRDAETGDWQTLGGAVDPDESPRQAAVRESLEEAGVEVRLEGIRDVLGGPQFRLRYRNGDEVGYVPTVFEARVVGGTPTPDGEETTEVGWFAESELAATPLTRFTRDLLVALGI
jgi:8-oxo-dGTP pyrophosphatase MutT (NUDIX family)